MEYMKSKNELKWSLFEILNNLSSSIQGLFLSLYFWENSKGTGVVLTYHIFLFLAIPFAGIIGSLLSKYLSSKISFIISAACKITVLGVALIYKDNLISEPELFGVLNGIAIGLYAIPRNITFQKVVSGERIGKTTAVITSISQVYEIVLPTLGALWIVKTGSYAGIFAFGIISPLLALLVLPFVTITKDSVLTSTATFFKTVSTNKDYLKLLLLYFVLGIKNGISWALFGGLIYFLVSKYLTYWGYINTGLSIVGITTGLFYAKFLADKKDAIVFNLVGIFYLSIALIFATNYTPLLFVPFLILHAISESLLTNSLSPLSTAIISEDSGYKEYISEYHSLKEIPLSLGRVIPLLILISFSSNLEHSVTLILLLLTVATTPFVAGYILQTTSIYRQRAI